MALLKGNFVDASILIKSSSDPVDDDDLSRKYYVDAEVSKKISSTEKGIANGVAGLDGTGKIPSSQLPSIAITDTFVVASQAAMLDLTAEKGDVAVRSDQNKSYILKTNDPSQLVNWELLQSPTDAVLSVNGQVGAVILDKEDVGLDQINNTSDANKPISTAVSSALNQKSDVGHSHSASDIIDFSTAVATAAPVKSVNGKTGVLSIDKTDVGLGSVNNTSDANKPISIATQSALDAKQNSIGTDSSNKFLAGDLTWKAVETGLAYSESLSWSGSGTYTMLVSQAVHGKGENPIVVVRELVAGYYYDKIFGYLDGSLQIKVSATGDVTITSSDNFSGKIIIK